MVQVQLSNRMRVFHLLRGYRCTLEADEIWLKTFKKIVYFARAARKTFV